jgi:hypothetical protein
LRDRKSENCTKGITKDWPKLGGSITLPNGLKVRITAAADPNRPWAAVASGRLWYVCREHGQHDAGGFYFGGRATPLLLDEVSARALADALNTVRAFG